MDKIHNAIQNLGNPQVLNETARTLDRLSDDPVNLPKLLQYLYEGVDRGDRRWEIRSAVRACAQALQPESYLEIGVRRGWSLIQVAAVSPKTHITGLDLWVPGYGGVDNPGPSFVNEEIKKAAPEYEGRTTWISGSSHEVLPTMSETFDMITVDGDHTGAGARADIEQSIPLLNPGGAMIFDDILPISDAGESLRDVWNSLKREGWLYVEYYGLVPCGVAFRLS